MRLMKTNEKGLSPQFPPTHPTALTHTQTQTDKKCTERDEKKRGEKTKRKKQNRRAEKRPSVFTDVMTSQG